VLSAAVLGIDVTVLIAITVVVLGAGAWAAALAVGFGLRGLSANVAASRYVAEGLAAGDRLRLEGVAGMVERIGHALTTVRAAAGHVFLIPNAYFLEHVVETEAPGSPGAA
jgi:small-conductance mechanosensitive channel